MARQIRLSAQWSRVGKTTASVRDPGPQYPRTAGSSPHRAFARLKPCYTPPPMRHFLDFEKPIAELEGKIEELRRLSEPDGLNITAEIARLTSVADRQLRAIYAKLTPCQKTQVARHPDRPKAIDYISGLIAGFTPLAGDRAFADDAAVIGGLGRFRGRSVVVLGTEKGSDTESRIA